MQKSQNGVPNCSKCGARMPKLLDAAPIGIALICCKCEKGKPAVVRVSLEDRGRRTDDVSLIYDIIAARRGATRFPRMPIRVRA